jgi:hypothetical protein
MIRSPISTRAVSSTAAFGRPPEQVCSPRRLGAARPTRHSFVPSMLRRAAQQGWSVQVERWDIDRDGRGEAVYRVDAEEHPLRFVAFSQVIDESERTDRVIAERWDVTGALIRGDLDPRRLATLRREVPRQEYGCADAQTVVWARANRSARHFDRVVARLAAGRQPDRHALGWSAYVLRSTAFYANGKFGMSSFEELADCPPLASAYRAQMLVAWLLRELSCDLVDHLAAHRDARATTLSPHWRRLIGLGNATGLGLVPFPIDHPAIFDTWCSVRELALSYAIAAPPARVAAGDEAVRCRLARARAFLAVRADEPYAPFRSAGELAGELVRVERQASRATSWEALWRWTEDEVGVETQEVLLSCLVDELAELDETIERRLAFTDSPDPVPTGTAGALRAELEERYGWALDLARAPQSARYFWYYAADSEEPRRGERGRDPGEGVAMAVDVPARMSRLHADLDRMPATWSVARFLLAHPEHRQALARVIATRELRYGEPRVNVEAADFLPLELQRFQLATYGAENFIPQSNAWLRVTFMQGAPSRHELASYRGPTNPLFIEELGHEA